MLSGILLGEVNVESTSDKGLMLRRVLGEGGCM